MKPRILIAQPSLQPPGGGTAVAAWFIEALKRDYDLTVYGWEPVDCDAINRYTGTSLRPDDVHVRLIPRSLFRARRLLRIRAALWQRYILLRYVRRVANEFDLVISVNNEIDIGRRAIQYIHFPWGWWPRPDADLRWFHRIPGLLPLYYRIGDALAPVSRERIARNRALVNSDWTGAKFRQLYGGGTTTVYPPIAANANARSWTTRENAFVILGVIAPHKQIETAATIVERVRAAGHPVGLHIAGSIDDRAYFRKVRRIPGVRIHLDLSRADLQSLLGRVRYGIHATSDEHFGMAPAEMARSGCIVFVPDSGGQVEVVGHDERLTWRSADDAVEKIIRVLNDDGLQQELQRELLAHSANFSYDRFRDQVRAIVAEELAGS